MLNLGVSIQPCVPGKETRVVEARPSECSTCGAPGGEAGELLERHITSQGNTRASRYLCPLCHACLHLDHAGRIRAGRIVWLPEISQEQLNLLCLASFVAASKAGVYRKHADTKAMIEHIMRLYRTFEKRSESIEVFLSGQSASALMPRQTLSSPTHIASLIVSARRETKLDARTVARRIEGMRLLPNPGAFQTYIDKLSRMTAKTFPVQSWMGAVQTVLDEAAAAAAAPESTESFDGSDESLFATSEDSTEEVHGDPAF
jgi:hypothetical protein